MDETLAPPRNFFISTADRVRAAHGPPAYSRRKRHIEDLEASLVAMARDAMKKFATEATDGAEKDAFAALAAHAPFVKALREMNRLVAAHNLYYPIEANLRLDPATRQELARPPVQTAPGRDARRHHGACACDCRHRLSALERSRWPSAITLPRARARGKA